MFSKTTLEKLDTESRRLVVSSIVDLTKSRVIEIQTAENMQKILAGPADEPPEDLAKRILKFRSANAALVALSILGESLKKGLDNELE